MVTGERLKLTLSGGAPWGFRLQGGGNYPLEVAKIRKNSHSQRAGLKEGDVVLGINGYPLSGKSHQSAMDIVEMASGQIVFEVARPAGAHGASQPLDPQRHTRVITMMSSHENASPRKVSSAPRGHTSTEGNTLRNIQTNKFVMRDGDDRQFTKTTTEQATRYGSSAGVSPAVSYTSIGSTEHKSRSPNRSPLIWQPPLQNRSNLKKSQSTLDISYGQRKSSPVMWQPRSLSPAPGSHGRPASVQSGSLDRVSMRSSRGSRGSKENLDPFIIREQKKWEASHMFDTTPKRNDAYRPADVRYNAPKMDDPNYPMFELPKKVVWTPPKINVPPMPAEKSGRKWAPPVPPKPVSPAPSPIPFDTSERPVAGVSSHYPGMIRPPMQPNLMPAPPPPPLPPSPLENPRFNVVSIQSKFEPGHFSTPNQDANGYDEPDPAERPDHLHVFQPRVVFAPDEDSGMMSPDRTDGYSDISAHRIDHNDTNDEGFTADDTNSDAGSNASEKLFSDSAFYDDSTHRYPTIDEQMSMCKKIAQSLTSFANTRAKGARMFAKRKRKANKWIHEHRGEFGSEFSSSTGDVADLNDLDSELFYDEGGNKPLFTFRIPKVANQVTAGERMSLSKQEFERLRITAPKVDHHGVSPNACFSIAADLHKGGKNRGAKLFQKRQQRVEKFVIDDSNVLKSPTSTKLDFIVQNPPQSQGKSPWNAAAQGDVNKAFTPQYSHSMPLHPLPRHNLVAEAQPKLMGGLNFNKKAQGWQTSGPGGQQQSYYRESYDPSTGVSTKQWHQEQSSSQSFNQDIDPKQFDQYGNYNRLIKPFPDQDRPEKKPVEQGDYNRRIKAWPEQQQEPQRTVEYGDFNRKMKAWPESGQSTLPKQTTQTSHTVQSSYYSLPRGFKSGGSNPKHVVQQQHHQYRQSFQQQEQLPGCDL